MAVAVATKIGKVVQVIGPKGDIVMQGGVAVQDSVASFSWPVPEGQSSSDAYLREMYLSPDEGACAKGCARCARARGRAPCARWWRWRRGRGSRRRERSSSRATRSGGPWAPPR